MYNPGDRDALLALAREAVAAKFRDDAPRLAGFSPYLGEVRQGLFVTVYKRGELRGCVGQMEPLKNVLETVTELAVEAAFHDPRFLPLQADEFPFVRFEISLLSPMRRIASPAEITPGVHGVCLRKGARRGVLLPQVWDELPDRDLFLNALASQKADLEENAWREPGAELEVFTVEILREEERPA